MNTGVSTPERARSIAARQIPAKPSRVLVADDEHLVAADITVMLAGMGYTVVGPVASGTEAARLARSADPDIALLDIRMPDGDGLAAARALFKDLAIPVVILSAYSDEESVQEAQDAGVFAYLIKPAEEQQLRATIEIAWGRYRRFMREHDERLELSRRLEERKVVERAKWVLVRRTGSDESAAMRFLEAQARQSGERLALVAERVLRSAEPGGPTAA